MSVRPNNTSGASGSRGALARLRTAIPSLSPAEQKVAREIARYPAEFVNRSVQALATHIGVSEATIVRCARALGYDGLKELRFALAAEVYAPQQLVSEPLDEADPAQIILAKVLKADMKAITDTMAILDEDAFVRAVDALDSATRIDCYGAGTSIPIAMDAYYRFGRLGLQVTMNIDPHGQVASAANLPPGSVAFAVSHTGRSIFTHSAIRAASATGATCILLTSFANTPMGAYADIELVTAAPEMAARPEAVASRIAHLSVLDALSVAVAMRRPDEVRAAMARTAEFNTEVELQP